MTQQQEVQQIAPPVVENPSYVIDPQWYEERSLSLADLVHARFCSTCRAKKAKGKEWRKKTNPSEAWEAGMENIAQCCSTKEGYVTSTTPALEAVFRLLLANGNRPLSFQELHKAVGERWSVGENSRSLSEEGLRRIMDKQVAYGFREVPPGAS